MQQLERSRADYMKTLENVSFDLKAKSDAEAALQLVIVKKDEEIMHSKVKCEGLVS